MRKTIIILTISFFYTTLLFPQKQKLPKEGSYNIISKEDCELPKQTGKLEISRDTLLLTTVYKTDSSLIYLRAYSFIGFSTEWDDTIGYKIIYRNYDSALTFLFKNSLLNSDMIIKAYNREYKVIDHKGDTLDWGNHIQADTVCVLGVFRKKLPEGYKDTSGVMMLELWLTFSPSNDGWGAFPMFDLYLKGDPVLMLGDYREYLKGAKVKCLKYIGIQM